MNDFIVIISIVLKIWGGNGEERMEMGYGLKGNGREKRKGGGLRKTYLFIGDFCDFIANICTAQYTRYKHIVICKTELRTAISHSRYDKT